MAVISSFPKIIVLASTFLIISASASDKYCFKSIISFGDSITDTGNALHILSKSDPPPFFSLPPYGETFFRHSTGRCSDGRLIIDFIAEDLGLPLVEPFHGGRNNLESVNFAVVGATALEDSFFKEREITIPLPNVSLATQFSWFKQFLSKNCHNSSGFAGGALKACCGGGGLYNVNLSVQCGYPPSVNCVEPSFYVNWDGVHLTEAASKWIVKSLLRGSYTTPQLGTICDRPSSNAKIYDH